MKICYTCKKKKSLSEFHMDSSQKDKRRVNCKLCVLSRWLRSTYTRALAGEASYKVYDPKTRRYHDPAEYV